MDVWLDDDMSGVMENHHPWRLIEDHLLRTLIKGIPALRIDLEPRLFEDFVDLRIGIPGEISSGSYVLRMEKSV